MELAGTAKELNDVLPVLLEKEKQGLIKAGSHRTASSLVEWAQAGRAYTEAQALLVGRMLGRAKRRHRNGGAIQVNNATTVVQKVEVDVEQIAGRVLQLLGDDAVTRNQSVIEAAVRSELDKRAPRKVEITVKSAPDAKARKVAGPAHVRFERLLRAASVRLPDGHRPGIFLSGEASSGKTTGCRMLADVLGCKWHFNGAISFPHEMLGFTDGAGKYHRTAFREAYEKGGVYTFDEVDRSDPVALLAVNPHLANGVATFPDGQVKRHADCVIVCTANTWGLGADANYSGATKLDAAFLSRFPVRIDWDIDPELEAAIVPQAAWLARVRAARARARACGLKVLIDTRAAQAGAALIEGGYTADEAANMTYLANLKPEQRRQVEGT